MPLRFLLNWFWTVEGDIEKRGKRGQLEKGIGNEYKEGKFNEMMIVTRMERVVAEESLKAALLIFEFISEPLSFWIRTSDYKLKFRKKSCDVPRFLSIYSSIFNRTNPSFSLAKLILEEFGVTNRELSVIYYLLLDKSKAWALSKLFLSEQFMSTIRSLAFDQGMNILFSSIDFRRRQATRCSTFMIAILHRISYV